MKGGEKLANTTNNYNLNKPLENEKVNISVINQNMDIIDTNLKSLSDKIIEAIGNKVDKVDGKGLSTNDYTNEEKTKLDGIATGAEVNQNAFSNVVVGNTTISADGKTDTLTLTAGSNITLTPDATNDKITIVATDTTYEEATTEDSGLMSSDDKTKLDGIDEGANAYTHPSYTARTGVPTSNQTPAFGGTFSVSQPVSDATGHITAVNSRTVTIPSTTATTSSAGLMSATDKSKLDAITESADAVSVTQKLTSGTEIGTVTVNGTGTKLYAPTNTDTHYTSKNVVGGSTSTSNTTTALTNGNVYLNSVENGSVTSAHKISGSGATTVTTDTSGNIIITSTDNNTVTTISTTGNGNAITALSASNGAITATKGSTFLTSHPTVSKSTDSTSTASPAHGGTFTVVDSVTRDGNGHVTKVNTKTVTLPSDNNTVYTHPTTSGNKHIPSGGSSGQILEWSASGTAKWVTPNFSSSGTTIYKQTTEPTVTDTAVWIPI